MNNYEISSRKRRKRHYTISLRCVIAVIRAHTIAPPSLSSYNLPSYNLSPSPFSMKALQTYSLSIFEIDFYLFCDDVVIAELPVSLTFLALIFISYKKKEKNDIYLQATVLQDDRKIHITIGKTAHYHKHYARCACLCNRLRRVRVRLVNLSPRAFFYFIVVTRVTIEGQK